MPNFSSTPPPDSQESGYRLIRTPPTGKIQAHVISEQLIGCPTHFVGNRTVPCEAPNCDPCDSGLGNRWHGYLLILIESSQEMVVFEMTKKAALTFQDYHKRHGTLRGCHFMATRLNQKANGRVLVTCKTGDLTRVNLPAPKSVERLMCHIWNIAPLQVETRAPTRADTLPGLQIHRDRPELETTKNQKQAAETQLANATADPGNNGDHRAATDTIQ